MLMKLICKFKVYFAPELSYSLFPFIAILRIYSPTRTNLYFADLLSHRIFLFLQTRVLQRMIINELLEEKLILYRINRYI